MSDSEFAQEKTEQPSARRLTKAREKGNLPRSRELAAVCILLSGCAGLIALAPGWVKAFSELFSLFLSVPREVIFNPNLSLQILQQAVIHIGYVCLPFFIGLMVMGILGQLLVGGWNFTFQPLFPAWEKLDPIQGIKRMFSVRALIELLKSLIKFLLVAGCVSAVLYIQMPRLLALSQQPIQQAFHSSVVVLGWSFLAISSSLLIIALVDVPFQLWHYQQGLRMTKQEVRDELKESEGRPEVKGRIRRIQRQLSRARMMEKVAQADVIITNPDHYAVALQYNEQTHKAPIVLAKGVDHMAFKIMEIAKHHRITVLRVPPLARSVYFTTELDKPIPDGLYLAVAQILAYVYQLKQYKKGQGVAPGPVPKYVIPEALKH